MRHRRNTATMGVRLAHVRPTLRYASPPYPQPSNQTRAGSWIGLSHQEAAQEDAQAQAQENAEEDPLGATRACLGGRSWAGGSFSAPSFWSSSGWSSPTTASSRLVAGPRRRGPRSTSS